MEEERNKQKQTEKEQLCNEMMEAVSIGLAVFQKTGARTFCPADGLPALSLCIYCANNSRRHSSSIAAESWQQCPVCGTDDSGMDNLQSRKHDLPNGIKCTTSQHFPLIRADTISVAAVNNTEEEEDGWSHTHTHNRITGI
ncbi:hypothetical protein M0813_15342 [Anaeramoeba flamelloides]|uniref:Uncharacterized protein n=1 Tax=Anaeramoeba flamelloides TaxID=1746091 RepID=A0ABQ8Z2J6_9EUKA|nr:hypothetical protein M0813_15342 [Anaeramoeba flamelloides]